MLLPVASILLGSLIFVSEPQGDPRNDKLPPLAIKREFLRQTYGDLLTCGQVACDGSAVIFGSHDGYIYFLDPRTGKELRSMNSPKKKLRSIAVSPNGKLVAAYGDNCLMLLDAASGAVLHEEKLPWYALLSFSPDSAMVACAGGGGGSICLLDIRSKRIFRELETGAHIRATAFSSDSRLLATATNDSKIRIWNIATGSHQTLVERVNSFASLTFSADNKTLACSFNYGWVAFWEVSTGKKRHEFKAHKDQIPSLTFSHDGQMLICGSKDRSISFWTYPVVKERQRYQTDGDVAVISACKTKLSLIHLDLSVLILDISELSK